jgi:hypothetical protein
MIWVGVWATPSALNILTLPTQAFMRFVVASMSTSLPHRCVAAEVALMRPADRRLVSELLPSNSAMMAASCRKLRLWSLRIMLIHSESRNAAYTAPELLLYKKQF